MCSILYEVKANLDPTAFGYIMKDDLLLPVNKITQLPENMTSVLPNYVIVGNYLSVVQNSANVWTKQLKKSLLNAKIHTHIISSCKRYWECDCKNYCCTSRYSNVVKCIRNAVVRNTAALAHNHSNVAKGFYTALAHIVV